MFSKDRIDLATTPVLPDFYEALAKKIGSKGDSGSGQPSRKRDSLGRTLIRRASDELKKANAAAAAGDFAPGGNDAPVPGGSPAKARAKAKPCKKDQSNKQKKKVDHIVLFARRVRL